MEQAKRDLLESKGWKVGTVSDFLELTPEENTMVEIKRKYAVTWSEETSEIPSVRRRRGNPIRLYDSVVHTCPKQKLKRSPSKDDDSKRTCFSHGF